MEYLHYPIRHVGSDQFSGMLLRLWVSIAVGAEVRCETTAVDVAESERPGARWKVLLEQAGRRPLWVHAGCVVLAPGKDGAAWMDQLGHRPDLRRHPARPKLVGCR